MAAELLEQLALVNVVVVGDMNPAIHRPEWYARQGILPQNAVETVLSGKDYIFAPPISQFSYEGLVLLCQANRWEIRSTDWSQAQRMITLVQQTFDALRHTPVTAVGFNLEREIGIDPLVHRLSQVLEQAQLGFGSPAERVQLAHTHGWKGRSVTMAIRCPGAVPSSAQIAVNVHHDVRPDDSARNLPGVLRALSENHEEAQRAWAAAATALKRLGGDQ